MYGNEEKGIKPSQQFINEVNRYPGLIDIIYGIDGLINKRSQHASGVILYNENPWVTSAFMRSPNGDLITQFSLHDEEALGGTKFDFLVTEICDKLINAINLLKKDGYFSECNTLREIYNKYLHPNVLNIKDPKIWGTLASGQVVDLFQFDTPVGGQAIRSILPQNPLQLMMANALTRLAGEKGEDEHNEDHAERRQHVRHRGEGRGEPAGKEPSRVQERSSRGVGRALQPLRLPRAGVDAQRAPLCGLVQKPLGVGGGHGLERRPHQRRHREDCRGHDRPSHREPPSPIP